MRDGLEKIEAVDGDPVAAEDIPAAVTAGKLAYSDGATQVFADDGSTIYTEEDSDTRGEWYVDDQGRFCSFWPPTYRACYDLRWIVENEVIAGLSFSDLHQSATFEGRYE